MFMCARYGVRNENGGCGRRGLQYRVRVCCAAISAASYSATPFSARTFSLHRLSSVYGIYWYRPSQRRCMSPCARLDPVLASVSPAPERFGPVTWDSPSSSGAMSHREVVSCRAGDDAPSPLALSRHAPNGP